MSRLTKAKSLSRYCTQYCRRRKGCAEAVRSTSADRSGSRPAISGRPSRIFLRISGTVIR
jgi:hypothetical protein